MKRIGAADVMTDALASVVSATSFPEVSRLLAQHDISAPPVLDTEDRVTGVVSGGDPLGRRAPGRRGTTTDRAPHAAGPPARRSRRLRRSGAR
ncbi:CBS domain-containing protein [Streptomyces sp. NPDC047987]|uniref:CBS domain-containing protein n=1 Tax=unclassified Streptomyces TaxID=2593676 RepID=UPI00342FFD2A